MIRKEVKKQDSRKKHYKLRNRFTGTAKDRV